MMGWIDLASAAVHPLPLPVSTGWSPTAWVSAIGSTGIIGTLAVLIVRFQKNNNDRDGGRWAEMMALVKAQAERIDALEKAIGETVRQAAVDLSEERKRCDLEVADLRKEHAAEVADIRKELASVYRLISSTSVASARLFEPREDLPPEMKAKLRSLEQEEKP